MLNPTVMHSPGWVAEFRAFILRGNVVDLAVGIIIGAAFTSIVASLVKDIFTPVLGLLIGGIDFTNIFITLRGDHLPTLEAAQKAGAVTLNVGVFLNAVIQFVIVASSAGFSGRPSRSSQARRARKSCSRKSATA